MKNPIKTNILLVITMLISINSFACDCQCKGDCSFSVISDTREFVALVKVIEYTSYIDHQIIGYDKKMPLTMTVEIIKTYKGTESREKITIWGDNGNQCRPYLSEFEIGECYLIAPNLLDYDSEIGAKNDYDFFSCHSDFILVDFDKKIALGEYSRKRKEISLEEFERELKK
ncbi:MULTISPECIES: hypothetical protein [unclassified Arenibacter]|uniref:hypothetical protein n=1 Tax=unclassified Arenibacter TaxID=2615047 RepID=UPI000E3574A3|nr:MULTISPECIES: hypothetical protein [unclassified Arenibacter]MCM4166041.1 hypothetical protein [Arenibacter sp. A80]RFT54319.1 hypothetical protein D0S24_20765 [Arenibacter sp. P308M17]